ncbi:MAG: hypothetical protein CSA65_04260 [Proteobacteria bacterium]|nr:MAG: hypothetical protein CSB49_07610 [Pseudomonadota bacterium]PIE18659.1 MAG: hypothetical protein CSA65_04260 [Pseudomonadota bacterium]
MPLYEFTCEACQHTFDAMKPMDRRDEPEPCPSCGKAAYLQMSAAAVLSGAAPCAKVEQGVAPACCSRQGGRCPY